MPRDLCSSGFSHLTPQEELKTLCFISPLLTSYPGSGQQKLDHVLANHCGCRLEPSRSASTVGCAELTFTACLALFSTFFLLFFFFFFFLPLLTQSNVSHIFFYACHLSCIPVCCPIPQHAGCMALMPLDVLVCGPPPGSERAQQRNFVSPARALFRDNNNSRRKVSCEERSNRRGNTGLRGKPRRC